jgi:hypothetical protein
MEVADPADPQTEFRARSAEVSDRNILRLPGYSPGCQSGGRQCRHMEPRMVSRRQSEFLAVRTVDSYERRQGRPA